MYVIVHESRSEVFRFALTFRWALQRYVKAGEVFHVYFDPETKYTVAAKLPSK